MKYIIFIILTQSIGHFAHCQVDSISKNILESLLRKEQPNGTIYYTDKLHDEFIVRIRESLKGRRFSRQIDLLPHDTLYLSKAEKKYMDSNLNYLASVTWADSLFKNSIRIPKDSMWSRIRNQNRIFIENQMKDTTKGKDNRFFKARIENANTFQFSPLIFFRNKSIFLVYYLRLCGGECGVDDLSFYKLENGTYKKWFLVSGSAF